MHTDPQLDEFERYLTGGFEHNVLHFVMQGPADDDPEGTPDEPTIVMFMMDVEYDPVRITFDPEGGYPIIHADGHEWHTFTPEQLEFIVEKSREAAAMWEELVRAEGFEPPT